MTYVPPSGSWESRAPAELGLRADGLAAAIAFHRAHESQWARDFMTASGRFIGVADEPPDSRVLGPVKPRGDVNGVVIRHGYIAADLCENSAGVATEAGGALRSARDVHPATGSPSRSPASLEVPALRAKAGDPWTRCLPRSASSSLCSRAGSTASSRRSSTTCSRRTASCARSAVAAGSGSLTTSGAAWL